MLARQTLGLLRTGLSVSRRRLALTGARVVAAASSAAVPQHAAPSVVRTRRYAHTNVASTESGPTPIQHDSHPPPTALAREAHVKSMAEYERLYAESLNNPDAFWRRMAQDIDWAKPFDTVQSGKNAYDTEWFVGGELNACFNCVDRHALGKRANKIAIFWESDDSKEVRRITYKQLHGEVQRAANMIKSLGVTRDDTVVLYLPMIPESVISMLACARLGVKHCVVFAGFSQDALRDRIQSSKATVVITADEMMRGGKPLSLKKIVDAAVKGCDSVKHTIVVRRTGASTDMQSGRDRWWHEEMAKANPVCAPVNVASSDPLFLLYTSGSTGKPKGLLHNTGGYLTYAAMTTKYAFDLKEEDVYACTADVGWITGHTYIVYGPLALGATSFLFEGHPGYPHQGRFWELVQKHKISILYTSPTAVRSLMRHGEEPVKKWDRSSLRIFGSVGEPINPEAWKWLYAKVGESKSPIIDTYWQTESGGILLSPLPGATTLKPGSCTFPMFGIEPALLDPVSHKLLPAKKGEEQTGALVVQRPWPGLAKTIMDDHARFKSAYFNSAEYPNAYITGDSAKRDADGYFWIIGRMDDVMNVSGHRIGSAEVESALVSHPSASEAAVVGIPHEIKGEALFAFVALRDGTKADVATIVSELKKAVPTEIGKLAIPDHILLVQHLPKTRSGKIMRRLLRQLALRKNDPASLGDTSTLLDPSVVDTIGKQVEEELAKKPNTKK